MLSYFLVVPFEYFLSTNFFSFDCKLYIFTVNIIYLYWERKETDELSKVAIYGAGVAGRNLAKDLFMAPNINQSALLMII